MKITLKEFTDRVNFLLRKEVDILNEQYERGESLFGSEYIDYPESMMKYYYENNYSPEDVLRAMEAEYEHEARWEAMVSW